MTKKWRGEGDSSQCPSEGRRPVLPSFTGYTSGIPAVECLWIHTSVMCVGIHHTSVMDPQALHPWWCKFSCPHEAVH